ncbi:MAG TPA: adhesin, partial [Myxococcaceae bacterium]
MLAALVCTLPALAGPDTVALGSGRDGALTVTTVGQVVNVYARVTAPLLPGDTALAFGGATGIIATGDLVMVLQSTGIVPEPPSGGPTAFDLTGDPVGRWELARVAVAGGGVLILTEPLLNSYAADVTQVIRVPEYTSVSLTAGRSIVPLAWNGSVGGVVAFLVNGTFMNNGSVVATGRGFRGGQPVDDPNWIGCSGLDEPAPAGAQKGEGIAFTKYGAAVTGRGHVANGGAGGVCFLAGGGGGGNSGAGGQGGNTELSVDGNRPMGGKGGADLRFPPLNRLMMGGGGGAGHSSDVAGGAG